MSASPEKFAIMFADVVGSTRLYETLGDSIARRAIGQRVERMSRITLRNTGSVVKTIGDEVMCCFSTPDAAVTAAISVQEEIDDLPPVEGLKITVRIGVHFGPAILQDDGDLFGDAVNVAARMAAIAKGGQIITSGDTTRKMGADLHTKTRLIDHAPVKGKALPIEIYEIIWEPVTDVTQLSGHFTAATEAAEVLPLRLYYRSQILEVSPQASGFVIGRSDTCNLVVSSGTVSRVHAEIQYRRGKYILLDQSTNGTFVSTEDGRVIYLHREELPLWGTGEIGLGEKPINDLTHCIRFCAC